MLLFDHPLKDYTTIKIGGRASCFYRPNSATELSENLPKLAKDYPIFVLGGGSNTIFGNFKGCVVHTANLRWVKVLKETPEEVFLEVGAGTPLKELLKMVLRSNLKGLEGLFGIPRITLGGAVAMNAGAYGFETSKVVEKVKYLTYEGEILEEIPTFGYRSSPFPKKGILISAVLRLERSTYPVREKVRELNLKRKQSQPLEFPTAGSTFKNPEGSFAGKLLEKVGLKGYCTKRGLCFSEKHANFLVNLYRKATFEEVLELLNEAKRRVYESFGILLEEEVKPVGVP